MEEINKKLDLLIELQTELFKEHYSDAKEFINHTLEYKMFILKIESEIYELDVYFDKIFDDVLSSKNCEYLRFFLNNRQVNEHLVYDYLEKYKITINSEQYNIIRTYAYGWCCSWIELLKKINVVD